MVRTKKSQTVKQKQPKVLQLFLNAIGSVHTKKGYLYQLDRFLKRNKIKSGNYDDLLKADEKAIQRNLEDYLIHLKDQQLSPNYIPTIIAPLSELILYFYNYKFRVSRNKITNYFL